MAVHLQTEDGKTRTYPTTYYAGSGKDLNIDMYTTKCGLAWPHDPPEEEECDHLDCAVYVSKQCLDEPGFKKFIVILFALNILIILLYRMFDKENLPGGIIVPGLYILMGIALLVGELRTRKRFNQLTEFSDKGTINGIKAWRISAKKEPRIEADGNSAEKG
jgi:hypothetical protein